MEAGIQGFKSMLESMFLGLLTREHASVLADEFVASGGNPNMKNIAQKHPDMFKDMEIRLKTSAGKSLLARMALEDPPIIAQLIAELDEQAKPILKSIDDRVAKVMGLLEESRKLDALTHLHAVLAATRDLQELKKLKDMTTSFWQEEKKQLTESSRTLREQMSNLLLLITKMDALRDVRNSN